MPCGACFSPRRSSCCAPVPRLPRRLGPDRCHRREAQLKSRNDVVGSAPKGSVLTVKEVNGDWFWVSYRDAKVTTKGWIKRPDVVPFEKAIDFCNDELRRRPTAELYRAAVGLIAHEKGEFDNAIADYDKALGSNSKHSITINAGAVRGSTNGITREPLRTTTRQLGSTRAMWILTSFVGLLGTKWRSRQSYRRLRRGHQARSTKRRCL